MNTGNILETISESGRPPESRLTDPDKVHQLVATLIDANSKRSFTDAKVFGLFNGNPPYLWAELRKNGQASRCNANWRIPEAFLNIALTQYWDIIAESPTYCTVSCDYGVDRDKREEWGAIMTEEFERLNRKDYDMTYMFQLSQFDMVLFRCGPVVFEDEWDYRAKPIKCGKVLVPDGTKSNPCEWPLCVVRTTYTADQLYKFIRNPDAASKRGWNVKAVRKAILDAAPSATWTGTMRKDDWESYESRLRNNDYYYGTVSEQIDVAHVYYREFPEGNEDYGKISHCIVLEDDGAEFLFRKVRRFENWQQVIHPFYYDNGDGTHHGVKGLGIKAYSSMEIYNRLQCHLVDSAFFGSSMHFQANQGTDLQNLAVVTMGPYIWHPSGGNYLQTASVGSQLQWPMAIKQDILTTAVSNLQQYRPSMKQQGNPPTARQVEYESQHEQTVQRSGLTRYFEQLDDFWHERFRRASNPKLSEVLPGGKAALEFQERCKKRGVTAEAMKNIDYVRATRTIGYGSTDARLQALNRMMSRFALYDESGRKKLLESITAAEVGYINMRNFIPEDTVSRSDLDQQAEATDKVAGMKVGVPPVLTPSQNPMIYASVYLTAAETVIQSAEQGGNLVEIYQFLEIAGPAIRQQLDRMKPDPTRKGMLVQLEAKYAKLAEAHDRIGQTIARQRQQQLQQQQQLQEQQAQMQSQMQLKAAESQAKMQLKTKEKQHGMMLKQQQAQQKMALADAKTATDITRTGRKQRADMAMKTQQQMHDQMMEEQETEEPTEIE